jgi:fructose-bisphosphate aldolase class II
MLLASARREGYAIAAFNAVNLETAQAVVMAAEAEGFPVILQFSENAARYAGLANLAAIGRVLRRHAQVEVLLHYDHAESLASAREAVELGFDSVMLEGADLAPERNLERVLELVPFAHAHGAAVEAELEVVPKGDRKAGNSADDDSLARFARDAGCDFVALDFGSEHRRERGAARLDLGRLAALAERIPLPLVLHGGSSVSLEELQGAARHGVAKINVATELLRAFTGAVRADLHDERVYDPRAYLASGRSAMSECARELIGALRGVCR